MRARRILVLATATVLAAGCSNGGDDDPGADLTPATDPEAETAPGIADLDDLSDGGIDATRIEPRLGIDGELSVLGADLELVAVGEPGESGELGEPGEDAVLIALADSADANATLLRSSDRGETWEPIDLPALPRDARSLSLDRIGTSALVAGTTAAPDEPYLWATDDGVTWRGGAVDLGPDGGGLAQDPGQLLDGRLAMPLPGGQEQDDMLLVSADRGATWQRIACPAEAASNAIPGMCVGLQHDPGLWLRLYEVSADGRAWHGVQLTPDLGFTTLPRIQDAVPLEDGGWLGVAHVYVSDGTSDNDRIDVLARSTDGRRWETLLYDPCRDSDVPYSDSWFSRPVPLGDGWLVATTCLADDRAARSELHLVDAAGDHPQQLAATEQAGASFGSPVVAGATVVAPEIVRGPAGSGVTVTFLRFDGG